MIRGLTPTSVMVLAFIARAEERFRNSISGALLNHLAIAANTATPLREEIKVITQAATLLLSHHLGRAQQFRMSSRGVPRGGTPRLHREPCMVELPVAVCLHHGCAAETCQKVRVAQDSQLSKSN